MQHHEFEPGKLIAGLVLLGVGVVYVLDAVGELDVPALLLIPLISGGLSMAWVVTRPWRARPDARRRSARGGGHRGRR